MKKMLLVLALTSGAMVSAASGVAVPAGDFNFVHNPKTNMIELWKEGKMLGSRPLDLTPVKADPSKDLARRNELMRKGALTPAEQKELDALKRDYRPMAI